MLYIFKERGQGKHISFVAPAQVYRTLTQYINPVINISSERLFQLAECVNRLSQAIHSFKNSSKSIQFIQAHSWLHDHRKNANAAKYPDSNRAYLHLIEYL